MQSLEERALERAIAAAPSGLLLRVDAGGKLGCIPIHDPNVSTFGHGELFVGDKTRRRSLAMRLDTLAEYLSTVLPRELARSTVVDTPDGWNGDELAVLFADSWEAPSEAAPSLAPADRRWIRSEASFDFEPEEIFPNELRVPLQLLRSQAGDSFLLWRDARALLYLNGRMSLAFEPVPALGEQLHEIATRGQRRQRVLEVLGRMFQASSERPTKQKIAELHARAMASDDDTIVADRGPHEKMLLLKWNRTAASWTLGAKTPAFAHKTGFEDRYVLWPESKVCASFLVQSRYSPRRSWFERIFVGDELRHHPFTTPSQPILCVEDTLARTHALDSGWSTGAQLTRELMAARDVVVYGYGETVRPHQPYMWSLGARRVVGVERAAAVAWAAAIGAEVVDW